MKKAVIFDLDGTLLNTLDGLKDSTNYALKNLGYAPHSAENIRKFVGNGVSKLIERAIPGGKSNSDFETCLKLFKTHYSETMLQATKPYAGIIELLNELKQKDIKIAVLSNKFDAAVKLLCEKYFSGLIGVAVGESEKTPPKPNPQGVLSILQYFNLTEDDVIFVGDSEVDVRTAKNAGVNCVGVLWGFREKEILEKEGADVIINQPDELIKHIKI